MGLTVVQSVSEERVAWIDTIRGVAILLVISVHVSQSVGDMSHPLLRVASLGQLGVQLFFTASAYTLCASAARGLSNRIQIRDFYIRRFFRVAPIYYFGVCLYFFIYYLLSVSGLDAGKFEAFDLKNISINFMLIHGLVPSAMNSIVPGGWSIGAEVLFYVV